LPIRIGSVTITHEDDGLQLRWTAYDQEKTALFEIEGSTDGIYHSGNHAYSDVVHASFKSDKATIQVLGNPVQNNLLTLQLSNMPAGKYQVKLINNLGQLAERIEFFHAGGSRRQVLSLPARIKGGLFKVEVMTRTGVKKTFNVVVL
jgi:hypothetical protein